MKKYQIKNISEYEICIQVYINRRNSSLYQLRQDSAIILTESEISPMIRHLEKKAKISIEEYGDPPLVEQPVIEIDDSIFNEDMDLEELEKRFLEEESSEED